MTGELPLDTPQTAAPEAAPIAAPEAASSVPSTEVNTPAPEAVPDAAVVDATATTLLGDDAPAPEPKPETPPEDKPADVPPVEGDPKPEGDAAPIEGEGSQSDEPAPLPTYEPFVFPEGVEVDTTTVGAFTENLAKFEQLTKADHAAVHQFGQDLLNQHTTILNEHTARVMEYVETQNTEYWQNRNAEWKTEFENDPDIGGNRKDTTLRHAKNAIRAFGGNEEQQQAFKALMAETGLGVNKLVIGMLARMGEQLVEGKPLPAQRPPTPAKSKMEKRYGASS